MWLYLLEALLKLAGLGLRQCVLRLGPPFSRHRHRSPHPTARRGKALLRLTTRHSLDL